MDNNCLKAQELYNKGIEKFKYQQYEEALKLFEKALKFEEKADYYYSAGLCEYKLENYEEAINNFSACIDFDSMKAEYYHQYGLCAYRLKDFDESIDYFTKAIERDPNKYIYYRNRGAAKEINNDKEGAIEDYYLALKYAENEKQKESTLNKLSILQPEQNELSDKEAEDNYLDSEQVHTVIPENKYSCFGIDFGTTNSALVSIIGNNLNSEPFYYGDKEGYPMPSLVAIKKDGTDIATGEDVKNNSEKYLSDEYYYFKSIKSTIKSDKKWIAGGKTYTSVDIAAELFKTLYKKVEKRGDHIDEAVVAIPVEFESKEKECLRQAAKIAGFKIKMFVSEPTAAFCCNYNKLREKNNIAIFDWGGGTLDISIINVRNGRVSEVATGGTKLAGDDIDKKIAELAHKNFCKENGINTLFEELPKAECLMLLYASERAKCNFTSNEEVSFKIMNYLQNKNLYFNFSYEQFKNLIDIEVNKAIECLKKTVKNSNLNIETLDGILCVGGSSNLRPLREKLTEVYGNKIYFPESTGWNIAKGAAIIAANPGTYALSRPIGLVLSDDSFLPLFEEGQPIPCKDTPPITLALTEGNPNEDNSAKFVFADAEYEAERTPLKNPLLTVPVRGFEDEKITLTYYIDHNFTFKAFIKTNKKIPEAIWTLDKLNVYYQIEDIQKDE